MSIDESAIAALLDKQAIAEVLYRYCRAVDRRDPDLLAQVYHDDAYDDHGVYSGPIAGLIAIMRRSVGGALASHHAISNILIELHGDVAHVESYLNALHRRPSEAGLVDDHLKCRYVDRFERRDGSWKIARRTVIYDWGSTAPALDRAWWDEVPGAYVFGRKDREDALYLAASYDAAPA